MPCSTGRPPWCHLDVGKACILGSALHQTKKRKQKDRLKGPEGLSGALRLTSSLWLLLLSHALHQTTEHVQRGAWVTYTTPRLPRFLSGNSTEIHSPQIFSGNCITAFLVIPWKLIPNWIRPVMFVKPNPRTTSPQCFMLSCCPLPESRAQGIHFHFSSWVQGQAGPPSFVWSLSLQSKVPTGHWQSQEKKNNKKKKHPDRFCTVSPVFDCVFALFACFRPFFAP